MAETRVMDRSPEKRNMNNDIILRENEIKANRMMTLVLNVTFVIVVIAWVLFETGFFYIRIQYRGLMIFNLVLISLANVISRHYKFNKAWIKYILMTAMVFVCAVTTIALTYNVTLLAVLPILLSIRYFNKKYTIHISVISFIVFFVAYILGANSGMLDLNFVQYEPGTTIITNEAMWLDDAVRDIPYDGIRMIKNTIISNYFVKLLQLIIISAASWQMVVHCQELLQKEKNLAESTARIGAELEMAEKIQKDMLPSIFPYFSEKEEFDLYASMTTAREVGGDFYDFFMIDESHLCLLISDVSGKGIPAAMFMMTAKTMIKDYALTKSCPADIFTAVNERLCENNEAGMFATAWIGILDLKTMIMQFTNAGHNFPLIQRKDMPCEMLDKKHGLFLAGMEGIVYKQDEIKLSCGDRLLLYTDGVTEAHNPKRELFGEERLMKILDAVKDEKGEKVLSAILNEVNAFAENTEQFDDITMSVLTIK